MNTLFDKIWDKHVVQVVEDGPTQLYIDRLYCHEVTSPQAFAGLRARGLKCFRPDHIICMPDHNTPTHDQDKPIADPVSKHQVDTLEANCKEFGLTHYSCGWSGEGSFFAGNDHSVWRLAHVYTWCCGSCGFRYRHLRGRDGHGIRVHSSAEA